jgi:hypothetical protein
MEELKNKIKYLNYKKTRRTYAKEPHALVATSCGLELKEKNFRK